MANDTPLTRTIVRNLLQSPFQIEEDVHPWSSVFSADPDKPLLRTWDEFSGSRPSKIGRMSSMSSRSPRKRLDTAEARKEYLTIHADYGDWRRTPFISFTQSPHELQSIAAPRARNRGSQTITVLNPRIRVKNGLPILNMDTEMRYYQIRDPYRKSNAYYKNECICLWEVTKEEVVGHWAWDDLLESNDWYERVILPAFKGHNDKYFGDRAFDMSSLMDVLPGPQASTIGPRPYHLAFGFSDFDTSSEGEETRFESDCIDEEYDSYDEVEEHNAVDDFLK